VKVRVNGILIEALTVTTATVNIIKNAAAAMFLRAE
jgi:hypothetical protein